MAEPAVEDFDLDRIMREQVYLSHIPNYLMKGDVSTEEGLSREQDRLERKLLNSLGLSVRRR